MLETTSVKMQYTIAANPVFEFGIPFFSQTNLACFEYNPNTCVETELSYGVDYTVENKTDYSSGAKVTLLGELHAGNKLTIVRAVQPTQDVSLPNFGKIPSESLERQLDKGAAVQQQLTDTVQLTLRMPYGLPSGTTPQQYMSEFVSKMIESGGGGGGSGNSFNSAEFDVTSGGSVSIKEIDKSKITGLSSALSEKQDALSSGQSVGIKVDFAGVAGAVVYHGPFAVVPIGSADSSGNYQVDVVDLSGDRHTAGRVFAGGSYYTVDSGSDISLKSGDTLYMVLSSGSEGIERSFSSAAPGTITPDMAVTRLAHNEGGVVKQIQRGDLTFVNWGAGGGSGGGIEPRNLGSSYTETSAGMLVANVDMTSASSPGQALWIAVNGGTYAVLSVPQNGGSGAASCYTRAMQSGTTWSASSEINGASVTLNYLKLS